jgi:histidinol-phosphatase
MTLSTFEVEALARHRGGDGPPIGDHSVDGWVRFGLAAALDACRLLRPGTGGESMEHKSDGSPVTALEQAVEHRLREGLERFAPDAVMVGEETGGVLPDDGWAVAVDPVDGTWGFLTGTETFSTTLAVFRGRHAVVGVVANPATGEIAYGWRDGEARLLRCSAFGEPDTAGRLPTRPVGASPVLVNLHPARAGAQVQAILHAAWIEGAIRMVRSPGGSPSWGLAEAAKGHYTYVNLWSKRPAEPWDLAAGALVVRCAGGDVTDLNGHPIDATVHDGPFVAGIERSHREQVVDLIASGVSTER